MASSFFMYCYPWDLEDEGVEAAIGALAGHIGVDAVSVGASLPGIREHRGRELGGRRTVECDAAVHFQPDAKCYQNTRLRPVVAAWIRSRNPLEKIAREAQKQGLGLRLWVVFPQSDALAARCPSATSVDVFGDSIGTRLCPSNPDLREYLAGLVQDLGTNYPVQTIELEAAHFGQGEQARSQVVRGVQPNEAQRMLLEWCFCASCRQRACQMGIDADEVAAKAKVLLTAMYRLEPAGTESIAALLAADETLLAYHRLRVGTVASLLEFVRKRAPARLVVRFPDPASSSFGTGVDPVAIREHCDAICLALFPSADPLAEQVFAKTVAAAGGTAHVEVVMDCHPPRFQDGPALVAEVKRLGAQGHPAIGFSNYGTAPAPCLDWIRQAIRFGRRDLGGYGPQTRSSGRCA